MTNRNHEKLRGMKRKTIGRVVNTTTKSDGQTITPAITEHREGMETER